MRDDHFQQLFGRQAQAKLKAHADHPDLPGQEPGADRLDYRQLRGLLFLMLPVMLLWHTWLIYPLRMLLVVFHELSHGIMALLTGGRVISIELLAQEGGLCHTAGGNEFLIASAGYLGSLLWGGALLIAAARTRLARPITLGLGGLLIVVALLYVRPLRSFGLPFCLLAGAGLLYAGLKLREKSAGLLLKFIGLASILYVPQDILSDTILRSLSVVSDAHLLAGITGVPTIVWGLLWGALSLIIGWSTLLLACRRSGKAAGNLQRPGRSAA